MKIEAEISRGMASLKSFSPYGQLVASCEIPVFVLHDIAERPITAGLKWRGRSWVLRGHGNETWIEERGKAGAYFRISCEEARQILEDHERAKELTAGSQDLSRAVA